MKHQEALPTFRYHPDPVATGSVEASDAICGICGRVRSSVYDGPVYGVPKDIDDVHICPWCIADGSAHARFGVEFTDIGAVGLGYDEPWEPVPRSVAEEVAYRTPGFSGWQQERWWTHCGETAEFLGPAGYAELAGAWSGAVDAIRAGGFRLPAGGQRVGRDPVDVRSGLRPGGLRLPVPALRQAGRLLGPPLIPGGPQRRYPPGGRLSSQ